MKIKEVSENSSCDIDPKYSIILKEILKRNNYLPLRLEGNTITFNEYIIGELQIDDLSIKVLPRNKAFSLQTFFQILRFLDEPLFDEIKGYGYNSANSIFDIQNLSREFCKILDLLLQYGATGHYYARIERNKRISGDIIFENFIPQLVPSHGIKSQNTKFSINSNANQILKSALLKLVQIENYNENPIKYQILRDFDKVGDSDFTREEIDEEILRGVSSNPNYHLALELAKKILHDIQFEYKNGNLEWLAFLENSNHIFEKYIFRVLQSNLPIKIEKWNKPKTFAFMSDGKTNDQKSFSPDVLLNYNKYSNKASAVIDIKNKGFEPNTSSSLSNLVSSPDIYQLIFYCRQLNTNVGGLIYPSSKENPPIKIELPILDRRKLTLYLLSINMGNNLLQRHEKLTEDIRVNILSNI